MRKLLIVLAVLLVATFANAQTTHYRLEDATTGNVKDLTATSTQWVVPNNSAYYRICAFGNTAYVLCGDNPTATTADGGHALVIPEGVCVGPTELKCGEETWNSCTGTAATDKVNKVAHNLANGTKIQFKGLVSATASGVSVYTPYYVISTAANDFEISTTVGGAKVDILANITAGDYAMMTVGSKCYPRKCAFIAPSTVTGARIQFLQIVTSSQ